MKGAIDTEKIGEMIAKEKKLEDGWQLCVNEGNELMFTLDFKWANDGAIQFFLQEKSKNLQCAA